MPNCFQLALKGTNEPMALGAIDAMLVWHWRDDGAKLDEKYWFCDWYNSIGFRLAMGKSWDDIRKSFLEYAREHNANLEFDMAKYYEFLCEIADYLESHFTQNCWAEVGRSR